MGQEGFDIWKDSPNWNLVIEFDINITTLTKATEEDLHISAFVFSNFCATLSRVVHRNDDPKTYGLTRAILLTSSHSRRPIICTKSIYQGTTNRNNGWSSWEQWAAPARKLGWNTKERKNEPIRTFRFIGKLRHTSPINERELTRSFVFFYLQRKRGEKPPDDFFFNRMSKQTTRVGDPSVITSL